MIKFSVNMHRGCFGGCSFCTISAHQGKFVVCRSKESILKEARQVTQMEGFKGYISDLGGPSANMYGMKGRNLKICERCKRPSCIHPQICPNLNTDHSQLLDIYHAVDALPGVKKSFIGSGVRYDLLLHQSKDEKANQSAWQYTRELITRHVSGRLKVAPEHTSDRVLTSCASRRSSSSISSSASSTVSTRRKASTNRSYLILSAAIPDAARKTWLSWPYRPRN
jgi:uncharacterized radical SAM protein YgiQ